MQRLKVSHLALVPDAVLFCPRFSRTEEPFQPLGVALAAGDLWAALRVLQTVVSVIHAAGVSRRNPNQTAPFPGYSAAFPAGGLRAARLCPGLSDGKVPVQPGDEAGRVRITLDGWTAVGVIGGGVSIHRSAVGFQGDEAARR